MFVDAVREALALEAAAERQSFHFAGVSVDWNLADGLALLQDLGPFTEVSTGNSWANARLYSLIWSDTLAVAATPQLVLVERSLALGTNERFHRKAEASVGRVYGVTALRAWIAERYPGALAVRATGGLVGARR